MAASNDVVASQFGSPQSGVLPKPTTIASAATVAPTQKLTFLTGTVALVTITPPQDGYHELVLVFTNAAPAAFSIAGNIQRAAQPVQNVPVVAFYDPVSAKYWIGPVSAVV
jgi:hypothetical protein